MSRRPLEALAGELAVCPPPLPPVGSFGTFQPMRRPRSRIPAGRLVLSAKIRS
jgi:hypothetical protein